MGEQLITSPNDSSVRTYVDIFKHLYIKPPGQIELNFHMDMFWWLRGAVSVGWYSPAPTTSEEGL